MDLATYTRLHLSLDRYSLSAWPHTITAVSYSHDNVHGYEYTLFVSVVGSCSQQGHDTLSLAHVASSMVSIHILNSCSQSQKRVFVTKSVGTFPHLRSWTVGI